MGFLQLAGGLTNFSEAVISMWVNVPAAAVTAAQAQWTGAGVDAAVEAGGNVQSNLLGMIPLISFGPNPVATTEGPFFSGSTEVSPCFIGLNCGRTVWDDDEASLLSPPTLVGFFPYDSFHDFTSGSEDEVTWHLPNHFKIGYWSGSGTFWETFYPDEYPSGLDPITVTTDVWHHILVSFDFSSNPGLYYCAFDDVNKTGAALWPAVENGSANVVNAADYSASSGSGFSGGALDTEGLPIAIPTSSGNSDWVYNLRMADIQVFTGVSIDTGVEANRRAFVTLDGRPANPSLAASLLGKQPEILLRGSDWLIGRNTGTAGNFTKTGTLNPFDPGPGA